LSHLFGGIAFLHAAQVLRSRRDAYDTTGTAVSKEIVHAITSLAPGRAGPASLAASRELSQGTGRATPPTPKITTPATPGRGRDVDAELCGYLGEGEQAAGAEPVSADGLHAVGV
jgi:hypothetical protein